MGSELSVRARAGLLGIWVLATGAGVAAQTRDADTRSKLGAPPPTARMRTAAVSQRLLTLRVNQAPLRDVLRLIELSCEVRITPLWTDADHIDGLAPDLLVDLDAREAPVIAAIESLLAQTDPAIGAGATWQLAADGAIQIGPRSRLNAYRTAELYDVADLLLQIKDSPDAATIDLQAALQASQGSGSTSVLREPQAPDAEKASLRDPADELIDLITQVIEPDQWENNGGSAATIRLYRGRTLVIRAPGYIHRQIAGETRSVGPLSTAAR